MQTVYSTARLCKRPSDVATDDADKCYVLSPGQLNFVFDSFHSAPAIKLAFHDADTNTDADTDILARILADTSDTRDFLKLFLWQAERHADILATILARMSVSVPWNASFIACNTGSCSLIHGNLTTPPPNLTSFRSDWRLMFVSMCVFLCIISCW